MAKHKRDSRGKRMNPIFFVFCEGESEEAYVRYLMRKYRLPVQIIPKILKNRISDRLINEHTKSTFNHETDRIFLVYDIDVEGFYDKLIDIQKKRKLDLLLSNPCFELWYILHYANQTSEITTPICFKRIEILCPGYSKGTISTKLKEKLDSKCVEATRRARNLETHKNPSTNIYNFLDELERIKAICSK
jgi:hypothetical protein